MKILFIPNVPRIGTAERVPNLIRILSKKHEIVGLAPVSLQVPVLKKIAERLYEPWKMLSLSGEHSDVDIVFASQNRNALPGLLISRKLKRPLVFDSHGNPELLCDNINAGMFFRLRNISPEKRLIGRVRRLITVSEADKKAYIKMGFQENTVDVIPTCIDMNTVKIMGKKEARSALNFPAEKKIVLFFASYGYQPNIEAAKFINDMLAPQIPDTRIILAGSGELKQDFRPNVEYAGFVENLAPYINAADICIAPVWHGVGILEKVLLMLAYGKPTVVTSFAKQGIPELEDGANCAVASNETDFIKKTIGLLSGGNDIMRDAASGLVMNVYNWDIHEKRLFESVETK